MDNVVKKLITTQDYMDALGVDDETAQILRFYQDTGGTQLYYDGGVFADGLIGGRMYMSTEDILKRAIDGMNGNISIYSEILYQDSSNNVASNFMVMYGDCVNTLLCSLRKLRSAQAKSANRLAFA